MLPRETSLRQLKKLRAETKGKDIGDLTTNDRLNKDIPNMQSIANPVDTGIESWEEFIQKDNKLQTIAFKSKTVNKPLVKKSKEKDKKNMKNENILTLEQFYDVDELNTEEVQIDDVRKNELIDLIYSNSNFEKEELEQMSLFELETLYNDLNLDIKTFEAFSVPSAPKDKKQPEYTILGKEKDIEVNPNFGIGAVKDKEIKKLTDFNLIDPDTPKERTIGGNAGQFIDNDTVKGFVNRVDGKDVYIESVDEPMTIKKFNIKDVVKTKKEDKE